MLSLEPKGMEKDLYDKMQQMLKVIWSAVPIAILVIISTGINSQVYSDFDALLRPISFIVAGCLFLSVFFFMLIKTKRHLELQVFLTHLSFVFICIIGIHYSGGIESPLYVLPLIFFLFASVIIPSNMAIALSTLCSVLYLLLITSEYFHFISHINFLHGPHGQPILFSGYDQSFLVVIRISLFYLVAIVPGYLAGLLKEQNIKLELANAQLLEVQDEMIQSKKMAALGQLISGITHDIKNPLISILGFAELCIQRLKNGADKGLDIAELDDFLHKVTSSAEHCITITQSLLDFARASKQGKDSFQPMNLNQSIEEVLKIVEHQIYLQNIKIIRNFKSDLPSIRAHDNQLRQVFLNLIINAKDAMPNGGRLTIMTSLKPDDHGRVEIKFIDSGCGILQDKLDKIFDPFFTTKEKGKGTGLGLSLSYGIIKNHQGSIDVQSTESKGSMFTITLPIEQPMEATPST
jgi:signal transduction histidine kinase